MIKIEWELLTDTIVQGKLGDIRLRYFEGSSGLFYIHPSTDMWRLFNMNGSWPTRVEVEFHIKYKIIRWLNEIRETK